jgi:flavin-dependent dehydrogenase
MSELRPIEIIGGGLAGLSIGLALRRANVPVTIIEAGTYPRHRVCGEFITGLDSGTIRALGLSPFLADARRHTEAAWFPAPGDRPICQRLPAPALGISRHLLDHRLAEAFVCEGGELKASSRATDLSDRPGLVNACGRRRGPPAWIGLKVHLRKLSLQDDLELHLGSGAYLGLSGIEDGRVNACGLFRHRPVSGRGIDVLYGHLEAAGLGELARRIMSGQPDLHSFCAVAGLRFGRMPGPDGGLQIGDALAMIPPFTGNGMAMAFQSAAIALDPLIAYASGKVEWSAMKRVIRKALLRQFRVRLGTAQTLHPFLLRAGPRRWLGHLHRAGMLPLDLLYAAVH